MRATLEGGVPCCGRGITAARLLGVTAAALGVAARDAYFATVDESGKQTGPCPTAAQIEAGEAHRAVITEHLDALLGGDAALLLPATPFPALKKGMPIEQIDDLWLRVIYLVAPAAMAGLPQARLCADRHFFCCNSSEHSGYALAHVRWPGTWGRASQHASGSYPCAVTARVLPRRACH